MELNALDATHFYEQENRYHPRKVTSETSIPRESLDVHLITEDQEKHERHSIVSHEKEWSRLLLRSLIHLTPVAITAAILQLNFRNVYWNDATFGKLNEYLGALQLAAKVHEVLIVLSLSHIVLYYLQRGLCSNQGVPFGLFASAYHSFLGGYPLNFTYLHSWRAFFGRRGSRFRGIRWQLGGLALLLLLVTLMSLVVGPSSAIVVIPRLGWYDDGSIFKFFNPLDVSRKNFPFVHTQDFDVYIPTKLFPTRVTEEDLPGPCSSANSNGSENCPFAGLDDIIPTLEFNETFAYSENITIGASFSRRMFSIPGIMATISQKSDPQYGGYASATTVTSSFVLADYLSVTSPQTGATFLSWTDTPYVANLDTFPSTMGPQVYVVCDVDIPERVVRNFTFLSSSYINDTLVNTHVDIRTIWNESTLREPPRGTSFKWRDMSSTFGSPQMIGFALRGEDEFGPANLSICSITAGWTPMEEWVMSTGSPAVISNFSFSPRPPSYPLHIDQGWINAFSAVSSNETSTVLESFIDNGVKVLSDAQGSYGYLFPFVMSSILSKGIADGLARIGSQFTMNSYPYNSLDFKNMTVCRNSWCSEGPYAHTTTGPILLNGTYKDFDEYFDTLMPNIYGQQLLTSFPAPAGINEDWTRVSLQLKRYGYAYGFTTTAVKLAAAVLLFDAVIALVHCVFMIMDGRTYSYAQSLGELLALAMNSPPTKGFKSGSEGISSSKAWGKSTTVQTTHVEDSGLKRLQIIVDD